MDVVRARAVPTRTLERGDAGGISDYRPISGAFFQGVFAGAVEDFRGFLRIFPGLGTGRSPHLVRMITFHQIAVSPLDFRLSRAMRYAQNLKWSALEPNAGQTEGSRLRRVPGICELIARGGIRLAVSLA